MLLIRASVRPSPIHGYGCFTEERIRAGQVVWVFDPRIDTRMSAADLPTLPAPVRDFLLTYGYQEMHDGQLTVVLCGDHAKYFNHSETPNLIDDETNIAARDIEAGEELTCNYHAFDLDAHRKLATRAGKARRAAPALR
jgi:SET domain-containing protein